jgi:hypothetical protein
MHRHWSKDGDACVHTSALTDGAIPPPQSALALAAYAVVVGVEAVWVSALDGEVGLADVGAIQIRWRRRNAEVRIGRVAVAGRRPGRGRDPAPGGGGSRPGPSGRGRRPDRGGRLRLGGGGWLGRGGGGHDGGDDRGHRDRARLRLGAGATGGCAGHEPDHSPDEAGCPGASPPWQLVGLARWSGRWWRPPAARRARGGGWLAPATGRRDRFRRSVTHRAPRSGRRARRLHDADHRRQGLHQRRCD